jgi:hypothetical protein
MKLDRETIPGYTLYAPEFFEDPEFVAWLNSRVGKGLATWHTGGEPGEMSDLFLIYDHGEGDEADNMPEKFWDKIDKLCRDQHIGYGLIRLVNVKWTGGE